jgi:hypothetical protein
MNAAPDNNNGNHMGWEEIITDGGSGGSDPITGNTNRITQNTMETIFVIITSDIFLPIS